MNSIERIIKTVNFEPTDRVPVIAQVGGHTGVFSGYKLNEYVSSGEVAAKSQINALRHYGYDAVIAIFDACVEAQAGGSVVEFRENEYPFVKEYALKEGFGKADFREVDPHTSERMPELLKMIRILRDEVGGETLVVGTALGPATVASQLYGLEESLFLQADNPERFEMLLDYGMEIFTSFAKAQLEAGAHVILVFEPSASPNMVPVENYKRFILPRHKKVFEFLKQNGSAANWLHTVGRASLIYPYYAEIGVNIANCDYEVGIEDAKRLLPNICIDGNIKPVSFVMGTKESTLNEAKHLLKEFKERGGFILSSGCEIPPQSKPENIEALMQAVREGV